MVTADVREREIVTDAVGVRDFVAVGVPVRDLVCVAFDVFVGVPVLGEERKWVKIEYSWACARFSCALQPTNLV